MRRSLRLPTVAFWLMVAVAVHHCGVSFVEHDRSIYELRRIDAQSRADLARTCQPGDGGTP